MTLLKIKKQHPGVSVASLRAVRGAGIPDTGRARWGAELQGAGGVR